MNEDLDDQKSEMDEIADERKIIDDSTSDETISPTRYEITSFGADFDVAGLVKRLRKGDIFIPTFQRGYVWKLPEASRFVESLLLGLPVPGVFFAREPDTNKSLVIDGQQRLKTLQFFYDGVFNPDSTDKSQRVFKLSKVSNRFDGLTYQTLPEPDRIQLDDYILHATVIRQESPSSDDTSIYHVFERLNTGGQKLKPQEIREAVYHGELMDLIDRLNNDANWRAVYGKLSPRLKDSELILRFLAFYHNALNYSRPLSEFLNQFALKYRNPPTEFLRNCEVKFRDSIATITRAVGDKVFKPEGSLNAAVYDWGTVGVAHRLDSGPIADDKGLKTAYQQLLQDEVYRASVDRSTADEGNVAVRFRHSLDAFSVVK